MLLLEQEDQPGYHTTGRSAALYTQAYGNAAIRALTVASKPFFDRPPEGFSEVPLLVPRGLVLFGRRDQTDSLEGAFRDGRRFVPEIRMLDSDGVCGLVPALGRTMWQVPCSSRRRRISMCMPCTGASFAACRSAQCGGGRARTERKRLAGSAPGRRRAGGAHRGERRRRLGRRDRELAGAAPIGLVPKRRTAFTFEAETGEWPMAVDVDEQFYFKPESGRVLGSLADETPSPPCDAQPEEIDVAMAVDRIERATTFGIRRIERRWAGLRSFVVDKTLVAGFDADVPGFFWCAGQGGYGIQTAPAMGMTVAALAAGKGLPQEVRDLGLEESSLSPVRCQGGAL